MIEIWYLRLSGREGWTLKSSPSPDLPECAAGATFLYADTGKAAWQRHRPETLTWMHGPRVTTRQGTDFALCLPVPALAAGPREPFSRRCPPSQQKPRLLSSSPSHQEAFGSSCRVKPPPRAIASSCSVEGLRSTSTCTPLPDCTFPPAGKE